MGLCRRHPGGERGKDSPTPRPGAPWPPSPVRGHGGDTAVLSLPRIVEASKGGRLEKIEHGYESMDAFSVSLDHLAEAVRALDFEPGNSAPDPPVPLYQFPPTRWHPLPFPVAPW